MMTPPSDPAADDEIYEIHHIDDVQLAAIEEKPVSVEPSDLKKVTFKIDLADRTAAMKRIIQSLGAHTRKYAEENPQEFSQNELPPSDKLLANARANARANAQELVKPDFVN